MDKQLKHQQLNKEKRNPVFSKDLASLFKKENSLIKKEDKVWVYKNGDIELRNPSRDAILKDLATIRGYSVKEAGNGKRKA